MRWRALAACRGAARPCRTHRDDALLQAQDVVLKGGGRGGGLRCSGGPRRRWQQARAAAAAGGGRRRCKPAAAAATGAASPPRWCSCRGAGWGSAAGTGGRQGPGAPGGQAHCCRQRCHACADTPEKLGAVVRSGRSRRVAWRHSGQPPPVDSLQGSRSLPHRHRLPHSHRRLQEPRCPAPTPPPLPHTLHLRPRCHAARHVLQRPGDRPPGHRVAAADAAPRAHCARAGRRR